MTELKKFVKALEYEWLVEKHEPTEEGVRIHYRSRMFTEIIQTYVEKDQSALLPPVGTVGKVMFTWLP